MGIKSLLNFDRKKAGSSKSKAAVRNNSAGENYSDDQPILGLSDLYSPEEEVVQSHSQKNTDQSHTHDILDILVDMGELTPQQCTQLRDAQDGKVGSDVEAMLLKSGVVNTETILTAKAKLYNMEFRHIEPKNVDKDAFAKLDINFIKTSGVLPVAIEKNTLVVATSDPANVFVMEDVKKKTQMEIRVIVCSQTDIETVCSRFEEQQEKFEYNVDDIISDMTEVEVVQDQEDSSDDLEQMAGQSPVIKFVNYLINNAANSGASDIHIEPKDKFTKVRYRIDGVLFETMQAPLKMHPAVVSRIKIMSNLDISERRLPQDGKISVIVGNRGIDLRVSILPTNRGEKVVIRILDSKSIMRGLEHLGMEPNVLSLFKEQIELPHGILLVTGPTGSGKSTTLYSALSQMDGNSMNISTVEDPVEYELDFCNQVQANEKIGLDFATALRSLLRQDPDIMMIGEIRDNETARIAVQAALTGHLVLSTLHTNDAPSSVTRLINIGIDSYLIAASLNAILAQRLVRRICPKCKTNFQIPENMRKYVEKTGVRPDQLFHGAGCDSCRKSGYTGRVGIYELLIIDDKFRDLINKDPSVGSMRKAFIESGQPTLFNDGVEKVKQGLTTIEEVLRVTEVYGQNQKEIFVENIR